MWTVCWQDEETHADRWDRLNNTDDVFVLLKKIGIEDVLIIPPQPLEMDGDSFLSMYLDSSKENDDVDE